MDNVLVDIRGGINRMKIIDGARESFEKLSENYDVFIYSAAAYDGPATWRTKTEWLLNKLGDKAVRNLTLTHDEYVPIGDFLITSKRKEHVAFQGRHLQFGKGDFRKWEWIVDSIDSSRHNPLLSICRLASQNRWCLNVCCTTCGNFDFRVALLKISSGDIPITRWSRMEDVIEAGTEQNLSELPFTPEQKRNILSICEEVKIHKLAESCADYDDPHSPREHFLMCFGLLLDHMSKSENRDQGYTAEYKNLSNILCSKLLEYGDMSTQNSEWLTRLIDDPNSWLTWEDLARFE